MKGSQMKEKQWRVRAVDIRGRFRVHDSRQSAETHMNNAFQFFSGPEGKMTHVGVLQSRMVESGDDSTWNDEPFTRTEQL